ncbi:uncharacterized protein L201_006128 [Kwoniella dendrophila CBS 6074]|uniref:Uncharacterized protein n=1 Tax=Kwoniella dendrophila CBS 6074 TaxID=1295534 RepID=A0AAX4K0V1_9TREE
MTSDSISPAAASIWSIPALRSAIADELPGNIRGKFATISWRWFVEVIRLEYNFAKKDRLNWTLDRCESKERRNIYCNAVKVIRLGGPRFSEASDLVEYWSEIPKSFPNVDRILFYDFFLGREVSSSENFEYLIEYPFDDELPLNPITPIIVKPEIPKTWEQVKDIHLRISINNFLHIVHTEHRNSVIKNNLIERIKFYGEGVSTIELSIGANIPMKIIYEAFSTLFMKDDHVCPSYMTLSGCDSDLPRLLNLFGQGISTFECDTNVYNNVTMTFEDLYYGID